MISTTLRSIGKFRPAVFAVYICFFGGTTSAADDINLFAYRLSANDYKCLYKDVLRIGVVKNVPAIIKFDSCPERIEISEFKLSVDSSLLTPGGTDSQSDKSILIFPQWRDCYIKLISEQKVQAGGIVEVDFSHCH